MMTKIALTAGEIWLELDKEEVAYKDELLKRMENQEMSQDLLLMALGWLVYQKHVKWVPDKKGGRLFLVTQNRKEGFSDEKSNQNRFAVNNA